MGVLIVEESKRKYLDPRALYRSAGVRTPITRRAAARTYYHSEHFTLRTTWDLGANCSSSEGHLFPLLRAPRSPEIYESRIVLITTQIFPPVKEQGATFIFSQLRSPAPEISTMENPKRNSNEIVYRQYAGEADLPSIMRLVQSELSEPYIIYTYRYFLHQWPHLAFLALDSTSLELVGTVVCKQSRHRNGADRGYIGMLSVQKQWRKQGIAKALVNLTVQAMYENNADEVVLETEFDNSAALGLYETLGFIREKRLYRFYMNGKDAFRLLLDLKHLRKAKEEEQAYEREFEKQDPASSDTESATPGQQLGSPSPDDHENHPGDHVDT